MMSRELRDLETKRGLMPGGSSARARQALQQRSAANNSKVIAGAPGAREQGRKLGRALQFLSRRMQRPANKRRVPGAMA